MLCVDESQIFGSGSTCGAESDSSGATSEAYKDAWNVFRIFALGLLAIAGLVMILSQTMGLEIVDAYTIKKVLPRLLIAAIGVTLSWELMQFFVSLTNVLGNGIRYMIAAPFKDAGLDTVVLNGGGSAVAVLTAGASLFVLGPLGLLSLVGTALLAIFVAFLVLILRNIVVILLIITAPIAIVAYILPNTQKAWSIWWDGFSKALMMFPIIAAFIAAGHVFAAIATTQAKNMSGINATIASITGFIAYFAPYFLIPLTLRFAGGILGTLGGFANDRNRGMFDRLKKFRQDRGAYNMQRMKNSQRFSKDTRLGRLGNTIGTWATDPGSNIAYSGRNIPGLRRAGQGVAAAIDGAKAEQTGKLFEEVNKLYGSNDKVYRVLAGQYDGLSPEIRNNEAFKKRFQNKDGSWRAPSTLDDMQALSGFLGSSDSGTERSAGLAFSGSMGRLSNLYKDPEMGKANIQAAGILGLAAHGFSDGDDISGTYNSLRDSGESEGFSNAISQQAQVYVSKSRPDAKAGYGTTVETDHTGKRIQVSGLRQMGEDGHVVETVLRDRNGKVMQDENGVEVFNQDALGLRGFDVIDAMGPGDVASSKGGLLKKLGKKNGGLGSHFDFVLRNGRTQQAADAAKQVKAIKDRASAEPDNVAAQQALKDLSKTRSGRMMTRLAKSNTQYVAVRDSLLQAGSYYSHASSDIKAQAQDLLKSTGHEELLAKYDAEKGQSYNPQVDQEAAPEAPETPGSGAPH
jgi:hypothetical protein